VVRDLLWTEHLERRGRRLFPSERIGSDSIIINLRDVRTSTLFRWNKTREILLKLCSDNAKLRDISVNLQISYRMVQWILRNLRQADIVSDLHVNTNIIVKPKDPLELVPRKEHRFLLRNYTSMLETFGLGNAPLILYGDASWGKPTFTLELLALIKGYMEAEDQERLMRNYVIAAKNLTSNYGAGMKISFALEEVWLAQRLGFASTENLLLSSAMEGICLCGKLPTREDYFELHQLVNPAPPTKIREWIAKGYVQEVDGRYVYTDKAIERFRETAPTNVVEVLVPILDRKVRFITVGKPRAR